MANPGTVFDDEINRMEPGLDRAILRVIAFHPGKAKAVAKSDLVTDLRQMGFGGQLSFATFERKIRLVIVELRKSGHLICSSSGEGGYYLAATVEEYEEFAQVEYRSKIIDMSETLREMDAAAKKVFGARAVKGQLPLI